MRLFISSFIMGAAIMSGCAPDLSGEGFNPRYFQLMDQVYSSPELRQIEDKYWQLSVTGDFNGKETDRLTLFPLNIKSDEYADYCGFALHWGWADSVVIVSEKGTTPDLLLRWPNEPDSENNGYHTDFCLPYEGNPRFSLGVKPSFRSGRDRLVVDYYSGGGGSRGTQAIYELVDCKWQPVRFSFTVEDWDEEVGSLEDVTYVWEDNRWVKEERPSIPVADNDIDDDIINEVEEPLYTDRFEYRNPLYYYAGRNPGDNPAAKYYALKGRMTNMEAMKQMQVSLGLREMDLIKDRFTGSDLRNGISHKVAGRDGAELVSVKPLSTTIMATFRDPETGHVFSDILGADGKLLDRITLFDKYSSDNSFMKYTYKVDWPADRILDVDWSIWQTETENFKGKNHFRYLVTDSCFIVVECSRWLPDEVEVEDDGAYHSGVYYGRDANLCSFVRHYPKSSPSYDQLEMASHNPSNDGELGECFWWFIDEMIRYNPNRFLKWSMTAPAPSDGIISTLNEEYENILSPGELKRYIDAYPDKACREFLIQKFSRRYDD